MVQRFVQLIASGLCVLALTAAARADLVTFEVTGAVTAFEDGTGVGWTIPIGAPFSGRYTFDSETPDAYPDWSALGQYKDSIIESAFKVSNNVTIDTGVTSRIAVSNDLEGLDEYVVQEQSMSFRNIDSRMSILFADYGHSVFENDALPLTPPRLLEFESAEWFLSGINSEFVIFGTIDSLTLAPEPSSLTLLAVGVALARTRRRV